MDMKDYFKGGVLLISYFNSTTLGNALSKCEELQKYKVTILFENDTRKKVFMDEMSKRRTKDKDWIVSYEASRIIFKNGSEIYLRIMPNKMTGCTRGWKSHEILIDYEAPISIMEWVYGVNIEKYKECDKSDLDNFLDAFAINEEGGKDE